jgi:hypothetical protein
MLHHYLQMTKDVAVDLMDRAVGSAVASRGDMFGRAGRLMKSLPIYPNGWAWLAATLAALVVSLAIGMHLNRALGLLLASVLGSISLLFIEAGMLIGRYEVSLSNTILYGFLFLSLFVVHAAVQGALGLVRSLRGGGMGSARGLPSTLLGLADSLASRREAAHAKVDKMVRGKAGSLPPRGARQAGDDVHG